MNWKRLFEKRITEIMVDKLVTFEIYYKIPGISSRFDKINAIEEDYVEVYTSDDVTITLIPYDSINFIDILYPDNKKMRIVE